MKVSRILGALLRSGKSKGLEVYLQSIPGILTIIPEFKAILIVPESDEKRVTYIKSLIADLGISQHITWIPGLPRESLGAYILAVDFVVVPSFAE